MATEAANGAHPEINGRRRTGTRRGYAATQEGLFEEASVPAGGEGRSVGEMLLDVDRAGRDLLLDVEGTDAAALVRGLPGLVGAAERLWEVIPRRVEAGPRTSAQEAQATATLTRAVAAAESLTQALSKHTASTARNTSSRFPGQGDPDPRLEQIVLTWDCATALVGRYGKELDLRRPEVLADRDVARRLVMHGLYLSAHATSVALHQHGRALVAARRAATGHPVSLSLRQSPYVVAPLTAWVHQVQSLERAVGDYVHRRDPGYRMAIEAATAVPSEDPQRFGHALALWDIQAHRTLVVAPTAANLTLIARMQGELARVCHRNITTARGGVAALTPSKSGHEAAYDHEHLLLAIEASGVAWNHLARRVHDLAPPAARLDQRLADAAAQLRAAHRQATAPGRDTTAELPATALQMDVGLALQTSTDLGHALAQRLDDIQLRGPARTMSRLAHNEVETTTDQLHLSPHDGDTVWVRPRDVLANHLVPMPAPVANALRAAANSVRATSVTAAAAAAAAPMTQSGPPPPGPRSSSSPHPPCPGDHASNSAPQNGPAR